MTAGRPHVIILAGPNGAGKSTTAPRLLAGLLEVTEFVNADVIAQGLSAFHPEGVALEAGRIMLTRLDELARQKTNFAFETTLASRSFAPRIRKLREQGYLAHLVFLWLPSADLAVARVAQRVQAGGHSVPEDTIRRRYQTGLRYFFDLYQPLADFWRMYDSSPDKPPLIACGDKTQGESIFSPALWEPIRKEFQR